MSENGKNIRHTLEELEAQAKKTIVVHIDSFIVDEAFNSRKDYKNIPDLAEEIREEGLLQSPIVGRHPTEKDKIHLLAGFRRMRAIRLLREEAKKAKTQELPFEMIEVRLFEGNELEQYLVNLKENMSRIDLHVWEIGDQCVKMRERFQLSGAAIGGYMRLKKSHVNNCMRVVERVAPDIQKTFREGRAEPPFQLLVQLASLQKADGSPNYDKQRDRWNEWMTGGTKKRDSEGDEESENDSGDEEGVSGGRMRRLREAERMLSLLELSLRGATTEKDKEYFRGGIQTARFMMGIAEKVKKVVSSKARNAPAPGEMKKKKHRK
jgi:ParB/RepB/Spo0J family partition protein